jgi:hypothetical protein
VVEGSFACLGFFIFNYSLCPWLKCEQSKPNLALKDLKTGAKQMLFFRSLSQKGDFLAFDFQCMAWLAATKSTGC